MLVSDRGFAQDNNLNTIFKNKKTDLSNQPVIKKNLLEVIRSLEGSTAEIFNKSKTIFFPGDPAKKIYFIKKGAVRLSRVYESGEEITIALLKENSLFGVSSLLMGSQPNRPYHAVAVTKLEVETAPATSAKNAIDADTTVGLLLLKGLSNRILQTETMIETLTQRDMSSRLLGFLLILCKDFGVSGKRGITIDLRLTHQEIAEAIGSTRVTISRQLSELKNSGLLAIDSQKITIFNPKTIAKYLN